jgi:hypothetical protein
MSFVNENEAGKGNFRGKCIYVLMLIKQLNNKVWERLQNRFKTITMDETAKFYQDLLEEYKQLKVNPKMDKGPVEKKIEVKKPEYRILQAHEKVGEVSTSNSIQKPAAKITAKNETKKEKVETKTDNIKTDKKPEKKTDAKKPAKKAAAKTALKPAKKVAKPAAKKTTVKKVAKKTAKKK